MPNSDGVRGAGEARIIVAYNMLAKSRELLFWQIRVLGDEVPQIFFDGFQVLRSRGHDPDIEKISFIVDAAIQNKEFFVRCILFRACKEK